MPRRAPPPAPSSSALPQPIPVSTFDTTDTDTDAIAAFRAQANLKSIVRSDPSVQTIVETSVYSTIYHFDTEANEWVKQKAEGPLFVVRR